MNTRQDPTRREDLLFMLLHGGAASNSIARHVVDLAISEALDGQAAEMQRLREERHSTNEALSDAAEQLRVQRDRIAELETEYLAVLNTAADMANPAKPEISFFGPHGPTVADWLRMVGRRLAKEQTAPQRQQEDPHDSELHHDYALGRDLPVIPQQTTGSCPHGIPDCICGGGS